MWQSSFSVRAPCLPRTNRYNERLVLEMHEMCLKLRTYCPSGHVVFLEAFFLVAEIGAGRKLSTGKIGRIMNQAVNRGLIAMRAH